MGKVILSNPAARKLANIRNYYTNIDVQLSDRAIGAIISAFQILQVRPDIGRPWLGSFERRELIIPFGNQGFVALYQIDQLRDQIVILSIRHQREDGYHEKPT